MTETFFMFYIYYIDLDTTISNHWVTIDIHGEIKI